MESNVIDNKETIKDWAKTMNIPVSVKNEIWELCENGHYDLDKLMLAQLIIMLEKTKGRSYE